MKVNAPEKIYINPNLENRTWLIGKGDTSFIEYIRKDAFIEKAAEFISLNVTDYIDVTYKERIEHLELQDSFIDKFINYMKRE